MLKSNYFRCAFLFFGVVSFVFFTQNSVLLMSFFERRNLSLMCVNASVNQDNISDGVFHSLTLVITKCCRINFS